MSSPIENTALSTNGHSTTLAKQIVNREEARVSAMANAQDILAWANDTIAESKDKTIEGNIHTDNVWVKTEKVGVQNIKKNLPVRLCLDGIQEIQKAGEGYIPSSNLLALYTQKDSTFFTPAAQKFIETFATKILDAKLVEVTVSGPAMDISRQSGKY